MNIVSQNILDNIKIGALATVNPDNTPLITPLHFARNGDHIIWITDKDSQHSRNLNNGQRIEFSVWNDQKEAVYLKTSAEQIPPDEINAAQQAYRKKLGDFVPNASNPTFYQAPIGQPDSEFESGIWQHYIS